MALPLPLAVTLPVLETSATLVSLLDQITVLLAALEGVTVATNVSEFLSVSSKFVLFNCTPDTEIGGGSTTFKSMVLLLVPDEFCIMILVSPVSTVLKLIL